MGTGGGGRELKVGVSIDLYISKISYGYISLIYSNSNALIVE